MSGTTAFAGQPGVTKGQQQAAHHQSHTHGKGIAVVTNASINIVEDHRSKNARHRKTDEHDAEINAVVTDIDNSFLPA